MNDDWLHSTCIAVVGERGSGKTALSCSILEQMDDRPVHVFGHPRPKLVEEQGWWNMRRLEDMYQIDNAVVWLDEPQITIPKLDKRANEGLQRLLSIARHRDLTLVLSTCDTRWITRALEAFVDVWCVKDIEPKLVKQGSMIGKIIKRYVLCDVDEFSMPQDEYLFYARKFPEHDAECRFDLPEWWDERWSKPFSLRDKTATKLRGVSA